MPPSHPYTSSELLLQKRASTFTALRNALAQDSEILHIAHKKDEKRYLDFSCQEEDLLFDYSRTGLTKPIRQVFFDLLSTCGFEAARDALFTGTPLNTTQKRPALHTALRSDAPEPLWVEGADVSVDILRARSRLYAFASAVRSGQRRGQHGDAFTDVIHIGMGGCDIGPRLAYTALSPYHSSLQVHHVFHLNTRALSDLCRRLVPERTLMIINSKSFSTGETLLNAHFVYKWLEGHLGTEGAQAQCCAVTEKEEQARAFGCLPELIFPLWAWIGGRFALWGSLGLSLLLSIGDKNFTDFLAGARAADMHFCTAPLRHNIPVLMGIVGVWHRNVCGYPTLAILPYAPELALIPSYLQQLDMESNGKYVCAQGNDLPYPSAPVIWGGDGLQGQHAFYQMLHQSRDIIPCDFLMTAEPQDTDYDQENQKQYHNTLISHVLTHANALRDGTPEGVPAHIKCPGNRPSTLLTYRQTTPYTLGRLLALYEHRCFVQSFLWGTNPFDQWGVDYGKQMTQKEKTILF